jgi:hypothetical protein
MKISIRTNEGRVALVTGVGQGIGQEFDLREILGETGMFTSGHHLSKKLDRSRRLL